jgi:hypothetical protein
MGTRFKAESYIGKDYGFGYFKGVQIVAFDEVTGKRKYYFDFGPNLIFTEDGDFIEHPTRPRRKTPCLKLWSSFYHYKTGFNKKDRETFERMMESAKIREIMMNNGGEL